MFMEKRDSDTFELNHAANNFTETQNLFSEEENPFVNLHHKQENLRRLNDYDSNILKDGAYKELSDSVFKLEYRISKTEDEIKSIESQISAAAEIDDFDKVKELQYKLSEVKYNYETLLTTYNDSALSARITDSVSKIVRQTIGTSFSSIRKYLTSIMKFIITKMPEQISSTLKIKKSLDTLKNINQSVDKLVNMTVPYGENVNKYKQLSKYIIKANSIQSDISEYLNKKS